MKNATIRTLASSALLAATLGSHVDGSGLPAPLVDAIRRDDGKAVAALLRDGADAAAADENGATVLMHAAVYAGPDVLRQLVARGADVNRANKFGATALMWAVPRIDNLRVLLESSADVNARARNGWTALTGATRMGHLDAMKLLLGAGADVTSPDNARPLLSAAMAAPDPAPLRLLRDAGLVPSSKQQFAGPVLYAVRDDINRLRQLLDLGIDPREELPTNTITVPTFFLAARDGQVEAMAAMVDKGMNAAHVGARKTTALMLTAGADRPNLAALQLLLDRGADINAVDDSGRTALDWALTRGETESAAFLRRAGGVSRAPRVTTPPAVAAPRPARQAIELALGRLLPASRVFTDRTRCSSCHNETIPGIAVALARQRGLTVDDGLASHARSVTMDVWRARRESILIGESSPTTGVPQSAPFGLLEMAEAGRPATLESDVVVTGWARRQQPNGSWDGGEAIRPPLNGSSVVQTALAIRALGTFAPPGLRAEMTRRVAHARTYLESATAADTQEQAFKLLGLIWAGAGKRTIDRERAALLRLQRPDGGWAQMPTLGPDAYATGQALYALHAARMPGTSQPYRGGATYLLRTQLEDGTWFVPTRAFGVQPYFETGFPHGASQFISATGTAWAAIALAYTLESSESMVHTPGPR
jgi:ankyrin repeat protein